MNIGENVGVVFALIPIPKDIQGTNPFILIAHVQISKYARVQQLWEEVTKVTDENCYFRGLGKMDEEQAVACLF